MSNQAIEKKRLSVKQIILLILPLVIVGSTYFTFKIFEGYGIGNAYLAVFLLYWIVWAILVPYLLMGYKGFIQLFKKPKLARPKWSNFVLLLIPFIAAIFFNEMIGGLLSIVFVILNAFCEEILWRGLYIKYFKNPFLGLIYPFIGYAVWNYTLHLVDPAGNIPIYIAFSWIFGLIWAFVAYRSKSIRWTVVSHIAFSICGCGALYYLKYCNLIQIASLVVPKIIEKK